MKPVERKQKIDLIRGFDARERIQHVFGCSPQKAIDILQGWIREQGLRAYPVNARIDYDDNERSDDAAKHWWKGWPFEYLTESSFAADKIGDIDFEKISIRENELNELLEDKPFEHELSSAAWEDDTTKWIPLELAVHQVAKASELPWPAGRAKLFQAVNNRRTYALYALHPGAEPSGWFMGALGKVRLVEPAPPATVVDPMTLATWIAAEFSPESAAPRGNQPRGRAQYEYWPVVYAAARGHLEEEGGEAEHGAQARLVEYMKGCIERWGYEIPAQSTLKQHAKKVIDRCKADKGQ